jgi:hypothetical protein
MAPVVSSLASELHLWVKQTITSQPTKYCVSHEITVGATCTKRATYKEQATEFFAEASALNKTQQSSTSRNEFFKIMCNWMVSANFPWIQLQMPEFRFLPEKYYKQHIPNKSTFRKHFLLICYEET